MLGLIIGEGWVLKIVSIVGARPNFVKLAGVYGYFKKYFDHIVIHTGQHYDYELSKVFFKDLDIPEPDYYLGVGSGSHGYQVGEGIKRIEEALLREKPDLVVVYGDTNSTLAGALAAVKAGFPVAHVESGLRSFDLSMPEEVNRRVTDHISQLLFAPTDNAVVNLLKENVMGEIYLTGDIHVDVLYKWTKIAEGESSILEELGLQPNNYITVTVHRAENTDNPARLGRIIKLLVEASRITRIVFPIHPRTRKALTRYGLLGKLREAENILIIKPLGYIDFIKLLKYSKIVITDSGGVQRESYLLGKPCLVLRDRTEWVELVKAGWVKLVDVDIDVALIYIKSLDALTRVKTENLLGDGKTGERITRILLGKLIK